MRYIRNKLKILFFYLAVFAIPQVTNKMNQNSELHRLASGASPYVNKSNRVILLHYSEIYRKTIWWLFLLLQKLTSKRPKVIHVVRTTIHWILQCNFLIERAPIIHIISQRMELYGRFCISDDQQIECVDYFENYAPVVS